MSAHGLFSTFRLARGEAVWLVVLAVLLLVGLGIGEIRARRRAGVPVQVEKGELGKYTYKIDLNSADWAELALLPGIGEVTAKRIVEHREKIGGFTSLDQLAEIRGIKKSRIAELGNCVTLGPAEPLKK